MTEVFPVRVQNFFNRMSDKKFFFLGYGLIGLLAWVICGVSPYLALQVDFSQDRASDYVSTYPHVFLFPIVVVPFIIWRLAGPIWTIWQEKEHRRWLGGIVFLSAALAAAGSMADAFLISRPAIWEAHMVPVRSVSKQAAEASGSASDQATPTGVTAPPSDEPAPAGELGGEASRDDRERTDETWRTQYHDKLDAWLSEAETDSQSGGTEDEEWPKWGLRTDSATPTYLLRSATGATYMLSNGIFGFLVVCLIVLLMFAHFDPSLRTDHKLYDGLVFAFLMLFLWVPLRIMSIWIKKEVAGDTSAITGIDYVLLPLFVAGGYSVVSLLISSRKGEEAASGSGSRVAVGLALVGDVAGLSIGVIKDTARACVEYLRDSFVIDFIFVSGVVVFVGVCLLCLFNHVPDTPSRAPASGSGGTRSGGASGSGGGRRTQSGK